VGNEGPVKFTAGLDTEEHNMYGKRFPDTGGAGRKRPLALAIVVGKSGVIHLLQE
jgi:hypothetical protein